MATSFEKKKQISWNLQLKSDEDNYFLSWRFLKSMS